MDKVTIVLQDKHTIEELAKDPEVQIRIKDAIVDSIGRRALKLSDYADRFAHSIMNDLLEYTFGGKYHLKEEWESVVKERVNNTVEGLIDDALIGVQKRVQDTLTTLQTHIEYHLENYDIDAAIREAAEKVIREKFKR